MRVFALVAAVCAMLAAACADRSAQADHQAEWREVLQHKKAAVAATATPADKQLYADSVHAFVRKHPDHGRAREVWHRLQIEFADELLEAGRHSDAIRFYRVVLAHDPKNKDAQRGLAIAVERLAVTREKLLALQKGMSHGDVEELLGKPVPGWTVKHRRAGATNEAWYYRMHGGGLAAVYFRNGEVLAAEETAHERLGRLGS